MAIKTIGIGDNVVDFYRHCNTLYPGGCSFNFAAFSSMLGNTSAYLGVMGNDYAAKHIAATAEDMGIDISHVHVTFGVTPCPVTEIIDGERTYPEMEDAGDMGSLAPLILSRSDLEYIKSFDLIHTSVYAGTEQMLEAMKETQVPICMDMSTEYSELYFRANCRHVDYVIMSCSHITKEEMLKRMNKAVEFGATGVLATRGSEGSWYTDGTNIYHRPANLVKAVDTQGAGDSFLTAFFSHYIEWVNAGGNVECEAEREKGIYAALDAASAFTAKAVQLNGAFGHGIEYRKESTIF